MFLCTFVDIKRPRFETRQPARSISVQWELEDCFEACLCVSRSWDFWLRQNFSTVLYDWILFLDLFLDIYSTILLLGRAVVYEFSGQIDVRELWNVIRAIMIEELFCNLFYKQLLGNWIDSQLCSESFKKSNCVEDITIQIDWSMLCRRFYCCGYLSKGRTTSSFYFEIKFYQ